jgi:hypothetical protein
MLATRRFDDLVATNAVAADAVTDNQYCCDQRRQFDDVVVTNAVATNVDMANAVAARTPRWHSAPARAGR